MARRRACLLAAGLALTLAACTNSTVIAPEFVSSSYDPMIVSAMAKYGAVPTEVLGNPFDVPKQQLDDAVTGAVTGANFGPPLTFTTSPPADLPSPYSLVVLFNPAPNAKANRICYDRDQPTRSTAAGVKAMIVVCSSGLPSQLGGGVQRRGSGPG